MFRIDDATAATSIPTPEAAGTEGYFTGGNPATATPATKVRASWLNMIQEELRALVVYGGLTPSKTVYTQVRDAIIAKFAKLNGDVTQTFSVASATQSQHAAQLGQVQSYGGGFGGITPVSSTISLTNGVSGQLLVMGASAAPTLPDVSTMTIGQSVTFTNQDSVAHTITAFGAQTIVTSGVAVPSLILQPGQDIVLTARSSSTWTMASGSGKSQFNGMAAGRFLGVQRFTGSGTYNSTSGATKIVVELWGGGGGGAGCPSTGAGQSAVAGGGGGGAYLKALITSGFTGGISITIGAGGSAGPAGLNSGGSGGTTSFGAMASAAGGTGSSSTPAGAPPLIGGAGGSGVATSTTGTALDVTIGAAGGPAFAQAVGASLGGSGGGSGGHYGPIGGAAGSPGIAGASAGVGGSGGSQGASGGGLAGGAGSAGQVIVWEYA